jgi:Rrf2 family protein
MEMARVGAEGHVSAAQVAERHGIPVAVLAKTLQKLARAGIATGRRGVRGGYALARPPSQVTVLEVIDAFEPRRTTGDCLLDETARGSCGEFDLCRLRRLVDEVDELTRCTYASVTIETLVGARPAQPLTLRVVNER